MSNSIVTISEKLSKASSYLSRIEGNKDSRGTLLVREDILNLLSILSIIIFFKGEWG